MSKETNQSSFNPWPAIIGVIGVFAGALMTYFGTRESANAQIRVAQENAKAQMTNVALSYYGPISATQTAEARIMPMIPSATSVPQATISSQLPIPIAEIKMDGKPIGDSYDTNNYRVVDVELVSTQGENGYTVPEDRIAFVWDSPGSYDALNGSPMRGIQSTITIFPSETRYAQELIFCHYSVKYLGYTYNSAEQFIPLDQPITLVWDFTGWVDPSDFDLSADEQKLVRDASDMLNRKGSSFTYYFKRIGELWQWQNLAYDGYQPNDVERLAVTCNVSATEDFRGKNPGKQFTFRGKITFGDVIVYPYERPPG